ncbi:MAG: hypothetical protein ACRDD1_18080 [Planctomycetia bacterium]
MAEELDADAIASNALSPASANVGGRSAAQVGIADQILADQYKRANDAVALSNPAGGPRSGWRTLRAAKNIPPGAV